MEVVPTVFAVNGALVFLLGRRNRFYRWYTCTGLAQWQRACLALCEVLGLITSPAPPPTLRKPNFPNI